MLKILLAAILVALGADAWAQSGQQVQTFPGIRNNPSNNSTTVAVTNTFQALFSENLNRVDCVVQNTGTNPMYVFPGLAASATVATSLKIVAGQAFYCTINGITYQGPVSITGTATETFYASVH